MPSPDLVHDPPLRRGACPSVHVPFQEVDGALMRIRVPGGVLTVEAAHAIAAAVIDANAGPLELTSRANIQVRGVSPRAVEPLTRALVAAGLVAPDAARDERRNVLASPTAGIDRRELVDTRPLVHAAAEMLASDAAGGCSPKFGVLLDGGGEVHVRERVHDIALGAVRTCDNTIVYEVRLAEALASAVDGDIWTTTPEHAGEVIRAAIAVTAPHGRAADAIAVLGRGACWAAIRERAGDALVRTRLDHISKLVVPPVQPIGIHPARHTGEAWLGLAPVLGRLDATQLAALATLAQRAGARELRVTPWRGIIVPAVRASDALGLRAACDALGFVCDEAAPDRIVVACAGSAGCASGLSDAQRVARAVIARLAEMSPEHRPASVHVSGCEKGCAMAEPAEVSLVATGDGRYDVFVAPDNDGIGRFGRKIATSVPLARALTLAAEARR